MESLWLSLKEHLRFAARVHGPDLPLSGSSRPAAGGFAGREDGGGRGPGGGEEGTAPAIVACSRAPSTAGAMSENAGDAGRGGAAALEALREEVAACRRCRLCETRKTVVFGEGNPAAEIFFVGEAPGAAEDLSGRPFVGPAGQLLGRIIENAVGSTREEVFIGNVNKCRPPNNRDPEPDEVAACLPFLRRQVQAIRPRAIVALGRVAAHNLLGTSLPMRVLRGRDLDYEGIPVVVTWHPAYLLRDPSHKAETWEDIKRLNRLLGRPEVPPRAARASSGGKQGREGAGGPLRT
ncbi:MAG: hypothetical protein Fur0037_25680 [Planctomycetota bacterium]